VNNAPVLDSIGPKSVNEGQVLSFRVHATDINGDSLILSGLNVPTNATFTDSGNGAGSFNFNPDYTQAGIYNVTFIATDTVGLADSEVVVITVNNVNNAPVLDSIGPKSVNEGQVLSFRVHATDINGDSLILSGLNVPTNATFTDSGNGAGSFSFNPDYTQAGIYNVTFIATDTVGLADSEVVQITVNNVNRAPALDSIGPKSVDEGSNLTFRLHATDPDVDSIILDTLDVPSNATFIDSGNGAGSFSFNPDYTQTGIYNVTFIATDTVGSADSEVVQITVNNVNRAPVLDSIGPKSVDEGSNLTFRIHATDADVDSIILDTLDVPSNATFIDSGNGAGSFSFNPDYTQRGIYNVTFIATDTLGLADSEVVQITVNNVNNAPVLDSIGPKSVMEGDTLRFRTHATDVNLDSIILDTLNVPLNATFIDSGNGAGSFVFTPDFTQADTYYVTFIAADTVGAADSEVVEIVVTEFGNHAPVLDSIGSKTVDEEQTLEFRISATDPDLDSIVLTAENVPLNATFIDSGNGAGSFTFSPDYDQAGVYNVTLTASDGSLADSEVVSITVNNVNRAPVLNPIGSRTVIEGGHMAFLVTASDPDDDSLILSAKNVPTHAVFTDSGNGRGSFEFDPDYTQSGLYYVTFKVSDSDLVDSEVVQITVIEAGNQAPVLDSIGPKTVAEAKTLKLRVHATDPDGTIPALLARNKPTNSTFVDSGNGSGSFTFTPSYDQAGLYTVTFVATDGSLRDSEMVVITVTETDRAPVLSSIGPKIVDEGQTLEFRVSATDADGDSITLTAENLPVNANFVDSGNGAGSFTFNPDYTQGGVYNVAFIASDGILADSEAIQITVNEVGNQAPVLDSIRAKAVSEGETLEFRISATDLDGDSIILSAQNVPINATFVDSGNGAGSFTFNSDFTQAGIYNVTFIASDGALADSEVVAITVNDVNRSLVLDSIGATTVDEGQTSEFRVSATDPDGDSIILSAKDVPVNATFVDSGNGAGSFTFNPDYTQAGIYNVTFIASDGSFADSEVIAITVNDVNHSPVLDSIGPQSVMEGDTLRFRIHATDVNLDSIILESLNVPSNATFIDSGNGAGSFVFTPDFTQADTYYVTFIAADTVGAADSVVVEIVVTEFGNHTPVLDPIGPKSVNEGDTLRFRIHATDSDLDSLILTALNLPTHSSFIDSGNGAGSFTFTPDFTQSRIYNVTFRASDTSGGVDSEVVQITVNNVNHAPVLDSIGPKSVDEGSNLTFRIHATDADVDSIILDTLDVPSNATFIDSGNGAGSFSFSPDYTQAGIYNVTFIATDTPGSADSEVVQITVNNVNRAPALDSIGPKSVNEGSNLTFRVHATDVDLDSLVLTAINLPANSSFTDSGNGAGSFSFNPDYTQAGIYNVTFKATDPSLAADSEIVQITVNNVNHAPVLDSIGPKTVMEGDTLKFRIHATDVDLDSLILTALNLPTHSSFIDSGNGAGSFLFTPDFTQSGIYNVAFKAQDTSGGVESEVVQITVNNVNHSPVLDSIGPKSVSEEDTLSFRIHAADADGDSIILDMLNVPSNATFVDSGNGAGSFLFTPDFTQSGIYNVTFKAQDTLGGVDSEVVQITVSGANRAPVLDSIGPKSVDEGSNLTFRVHATDADGDSLVLTATNLPANSSFTDSGNGAGSFSFNPDYTQAGIYNVTFKAQDTLGGVDSEVVQITVNNVNRAPVLSSIGPRTVAEKDTLHFRVSASDLDGDSLVLNATNLPTHASFLDSGNGRGAFTFAPDTTQVGIYSVTFIASDRVLADSEIVAITVKEWRNRPPVLDSIGPKTVLEGDSLKFVVTASDSDGTIPVLSASNLPTNATFRDSGNGHGLFRFKPTFYQAGKCTVTFTAIDMSFPPPLSDFEKVVITIVDVNQPPVIDSIGPKNVQAGSTLNIRVVGRDPTDPDGGPLDMSAIGLPENSTFHDSGGGVAGFTFTPDYSQVGVDTVTFFCTDDGTPPMTDFERVVITVTPGANRPPVLDPIGGYKSVREGDTLKYRIHATDPDGNNPFLYTSLPRPRNVTFVDSGNGSGSFTFTPDYSQSGLYEVTFYASDGDLYDYEEVLIQVIEAGNQRPILDSIGPKSVTEGDSLIFMVHAVDPDSTIPRLRVDSLTLPIGASFTDSLNGRGLFEFHPLYFQADTYYVTFIARDSIGLADSEVVEITVIDAGNQTPILDSIGPMTVQETQWLNFAVRASDADSTIPRLKASNMPPGAIFQDNGNGTGGFGYHPDYYADSVYYVVFEAIDSVDTLLIDSEVVKITVIDVNQHPQISIEPNLTTFQVNEGDSVTFLVIGIDPDSVIPSVHVKSLPNNATFVDSGNGTGVFVFRPDYTQGDFPPAIYKVYPYVVDGAYPQDTVWDDTTTGRSIWVYNVPVAPVIEPINDTSIVEGQTLRIRVRATHPVGPPTLKAINLPTNATFKDSGGGIGGFVFTPSYTQSGVYGVTFIATREKADSEFVQITVIEVGNQPPVLAPLIDSTVVCVGDTLKLHPRATDPDGPSLTLSAIPLPTNSDFHDSGNGGGLFRFYPDSTQMDSVYHVTFIASDGFLADSEIVAMRVVSFIRGDANGDGFVNGSDVVYLINYLFIGGPPPAPLPAGDANDDGFINISDVVYLINYLFQGGPPPPGKI
jgi:hypothetical protein